MVIGEPKMPTPSEIGLKKEQEKINYLGAENRLKSFIDFLDYDIVDGFEGGELMVRLRSTSDEIQRNENNLYFSVGVDAFEKDHEIDDFKFPCKINLDKLTVYIDTPKEQNGSEYDVNTAFLGKCVNKIKKYITEQLEKFIKNEQLPETERRENW